MRAFVTTSLLGCLALIVTVNRFYQKDATPRIRSRVSTITVWFVAMAVWPVVWALLLNERRSELRTLPGLLWPLIILTIDIRSMNHTTYETTTQSKRPMLSMDANAICSLTFALSGILGAQNDACCREIFMYAIIGCVAFVMPAPYTSTSSTESVVIESIQKTMLAYATGMLLTGIMLRLSVSNVVSSQ